MQPTSRECPSLAVARLAPGLATSLAATVALAAGATLPEPPAVVGIPFVRSY